MIYNNTSLVHQSNFVAVIASYLYRFNTHLIKKTATHALKLFLVKKQNLHAMTCQPWSLGSFAFWKTWIGGQVSAFKKRQKKGTLEQRVKQLLFVCYQPKFHKSFTFITTRCSSQLTQHILTFCVRRSLRMKNFIACGCRFTNDFFCKTTAQDH